jgi:hypothetical protein
MIDSMQLFIIGMIVVWGSNILSAFLGIDWFFHANIIGIPVYFGLFMFWIFYSPQAKKERRYQQYKQLEDLRTNHKRQYQINKYGFEIIEDVIPVNIPPLYISAPVPYSVFWANLHKQSDELPSTGHYE